MKILIDFQGGAHGNYLEFVCNKFLAGVECPCHPFNDKGASHNKIYLSPQVFYADHYSFLNTWPDTYDGIVAIKIAADDLLPLSAVSLLRAGDFGYDNQFLEIDTYYKFNNASYRWVLDNLIRSFFHSQIENSYRAIKDPSWPDVSTLEDFESLPDRIKQECVHVHKFTPLVLDQDHPHCPRFVLREFYKIAFKNPLQSGFLTEQHKMQYRSDAKVIDFPFACFYHGDGFFDQISRLADFFSLRSRHTEELRSLHEEFLKRQIYRDHKKHSDMIFERIMQGEDFDFEDLDLLQEAYLEARLEEFYGKESKIYQTGWFKNTIEVKKHFDV